MAQTKAERYALLSQPSQIWTHSVPFRPSHQSKQVPISTVPFYGECTSKIDRAKTIKMTEIWSDIFTIWPHCRPFYRMIHLSYLWFINLLIKIKRRSGSPKNTRLLESSQKSLICLLYRCSLQKMNTNILNAMSYAPTVNQISFKDAVEVFHQLNPIGESK